MSDLLEPVPAMCVRRASLQLVLDLNTHGRADPVRSEWLWPPCRRSVLSIDVDLGLFVLLGGVLGALLSLMWPGSLSEVLGSWASLLRCGAGSGSTQVTVGAFATSGSG